MTTRGTVRIGCDAPTVSAAPGLVGDDASCGSDIAPLSRTRVKEKHPHDLLVMRQDEVLVRARAKARARSGVLATQPSFRPSPDLFAGELMAALASSAFRPELVRQVAARLGRSWLRNGLDVSELVRSYSDICQAALELALECADPVDAGEFLILSYCLNEARASAVSGYEEQRRRDASRSHQRKLNQLAGELAKMLDTALFALSSLDRGSPELKGLAEALLDQSLRHLRERIDQALHGVRADTGHRAD